MKEYTIHCNEEQLGLLLTAVELQMRMRLGQGFAVCENLIDKCDSTYRDFKEAYEPLLDVILRNMIHPNDPTRISEYLLETQTVERDMWVSLNDAVIGTKEHSMALGKYGLMKIEEDGELVSGADELEQLEKELEEYYQKWGFLTTEVVIGMIEKYRKEGE